MAGDHASQFALGVDDQRWNLDDPELGRPVEVLRLVNIYSVELDPHTGVTLKGF